MKKKKALKIAKKPAEFELAVLLGSPEEVCAVFQDWRCPLSLLERGVKDWLPYQDTKAIEYKLALASNPSISEELLNELSMDANFNVKAQARNHPKHKSQQEKILQMLHDSCFMPLFSFIQQPSVELAIKNGSILTGTSLSSIIINSMDNSLKKKPKNNLDKIKDWDFFFFDTISLKTVFDYLVNNFEPLSSTHENYRKIPETWELESTPYGFNVKGVDDFIMGTFKIKKLFKTYSAEMIITGNAITLKIPGYTDYQFILKVCQSEQKIVDTFDFAHCKVYLKLQDGSLNFSNETLNSILNKKLIYHGGLTPFTAIFRLERFKERGWTANKIQMAKIVYDLGKLKLNNTSSLKEHLKGFYFESLYPEIKALPDNKPLSEEELFELLDDLTYKF